MAIVAPQSANLRALVRSITGVLHEDRYRVLDMSRAGSLETDPTLKLGSDSADPSFQQIRRLEDGPITARAVPRHDGDTPIRYFLDGSQKTLPVWRVGPVPIVVAVTAAGILERTAPDDVRLCENTLVDTFTWIIPRHTVDPTLERIVDVLDSMDQPVRDPFEDLYDTDPDQYGRLCTEYLHCLEMAYTTASNLRARIEMDILRQWEREISPRDEDGWIVVDGRLQSDIANAIGLVKSAKAQHLQGQEAMTLYDLPVGHRTTAYTLVGADNAPQWDRSMWYLRMQNATGRDARHGLVRLETPSVSADPEPIDAISSWILAERAPRASTDARWATQIYPIHLLERMLKRRIQAITAGWPA